MNPAGGNSWKGRSQEPGASLQKAIEAAWEAAKSAGADPGTFAVSIEIETKNPIHAYIVTISPP